MTGPMPNPLPPLPPTKAALCRRLDEVLAEVRVMLVHDKYATMVRDFGRHVRGVQMAVADGDDDLELLYLQRYQEGQ